MLALPLGKTALMGWQVVVHDVDFLSVEKLPLEITHRLLRRPIRQLSSLDIGYGTASQTCSVMDLK